MEALSFGQSSIHFCKASERGRSLTPNAMNTDDAVDEEVAPPVFGVFVDVCDRCGVPIDRVHERGSICWDLFLEMYAPVV